MSVSGWAHRLSRYRVIACAGIQANEIAFHSAPRAARCMRHPDFALDESSNKVLSSGRPLVSLSGFTRGPPSFTCVIQYQ